MTDKEIEDFIKDINTDGDGDISIDELKEVLKQC